MTWGLIVEGHGEAEALPLLVRRIAQSVAPTRVPRILRPYRVSRNQLVQQGQLERVVDYMASKVDKHGRLLILIDADDDCPATLGPDLHRRACSARPDRRIAVVVAQREFEAWFLAAAKSLRGRRGLPQNLSAPAKPESIRGAKEWLDARMADGYRETLDQPAFTQLMDLAEARAAGSFDKLWRSVCELLT
jgi:hypothetical protein